MTRPCLSCDVVAGQRPVPGGAIPESARFNAHQDVAYPVPGQIIVAAKRHVTGLAEMTEDDTATFLPFVQKLRRAQGAVLDVIYFYHF